MRLICCTPVNLFRPSAALNRLARMRRALEPYGINVVLVGMGPKKQKDAWLKQKRGDGSDDITFCPDSFHPLRHCRAMRIAAKASACYHRHLQDVLNHTKPDGVIMYTNQAQVADPIISACKQCGVFVVADVVEYHNLSLHYLLNGVNFQQRIFITRSLCEVDGIIGISKSWCKWAEERGIPNVWIPSFAEDRQCFRTAAATATCDEPFTIVFIGHWVEREKPLVILRALRLCLERGVDIRMQVLGNIGKSYRESKAIRMLKNDTQLQRRVELLGFVDDEERDRLLANADALILLRPDNRETDRLFPTRLPEYMLSGNPVILSQVPNFDGCFEHRKDVWFVPPQNNPADVADAICHLAKHPEERMAIGGRGRETALSQFGLDVLGERLAGFLHSISCSPKRSLCH